MYHFNCAEGRQPTKIVFKIFSVTYSVTTKISINSKNCKLYNNLYAQIGLRNENILNTQWVK